VIKHNSSSFHFDRLIADYYTESKSNVGLVYLVNSECSVCIGIFMDFLLQIEQIDEQMHIFAIIEEGNRTERFLNIILNRLS